MSDVGGVETRYIYDGDAVIQEYVDDSGWVLSAEYVHGIGTDNVLAITRDGETYYYHKDGLGSVTELTDTTGVLVQAYEYDAWGIPTIYVPDSAIKNTYLFTGREWDAALGLYYYRARHYDAALGRFLQTDPAGYGEGTNLYVYVWASPTLFVDPTGLQGYTVYVDRWGRFSTSPIMTDSGERVSIPHATGASIAGEWAAEDERRAREFRMRVDAELHARPDTQEIEEFVQGIGHTFRSAFDYGREEGTKLADPWFPGPVGEALGNAWGAVSGTGAGLMKLGGDVSGGSRLGKGISGYDIDVRGEITADEARTELYAGLRESGWTLLCAALPAAVQRWAALSVADDIARTRVITQNRVVGPRMVPRSTVPSGAAGRSVADDLPTVTTRSTPNPSKTAGALDDSLTVVDDAGAPRAGALEEVHGSGPNPSKGPTEPYTRSSLARGREMHKAYRADEVLGKVRRKEVTLPSGRRADFMDFEKKLVYELKPNNPRAIREGVKQLEGYLKEVRQWFQDDTWKDILDRY